MRHWIIIYLALPIAISDVFASENQLSNTLTLNQVIVQVLEQNPLLKTADFEAKAAAARIRAAQLSPALRASLEMENFGGSGVTSGIRQVESTLRLSKVIELGQKAQLRGELAQHNALMLRNEQDTKRLDLLAEATKRFIHVLTDQQRLIIAKESLRLAKHTQAVVQQRVEAGKSPQVELGRARISLAQQELTLEHAHHELATSRLKLVTLWGATQSSFNEALGDYFAIESLDAFDEIAQRLQRNPDLVRFATQQRMAQTRIELANAKRRPDIEVSGGVRHFNDSDDAGLVFLFNIPLGTAAQAAPSVDEAQMLGQLEPYLYEQQRLSLYATLFELYQEIKHAQTAVSSLRETIIPLAEQVLQDYELGYRAGRYSFLAYTEAQRALLDARQQAVMVAADYHQYRIEIDRLTGAGLTTGVQP